MANSFYFAAGALLFLLTNSVHPTPLCPIAKGDSCDEVKFYLWTRSNPNEPQEVSAGNVTASHFNATHPTKMIIHGYASDMNLAQLAAIREEYLSYGYYNLIYPEYLSLADSPCYITAVVNVRYVGKCIAKFMRALDVPRTRDRGGVYQVLDLHVIGFSLGGQTAAFAAQNLKPDLLLKRISGLDPALPLFYSNNKDSKLSADDAEFVDVLHTNAYVQGQVQQCGHVDFYMNGGVNQPGCWSWTTRIWDVMECDHHRAPTYFAESIRSREGFWGWACPSMEAYELGNCPGQGAAHLAGDGADRRSEGFIVVETRSEAPFARGKWWRTDDTAATQPPSPSTPCDQEPCVMAVR